MSPPEPIGPLGRRVGDLRVALALSLRQGAKLCRMSEVDLGRLERGLVGIDVFRFTDLVHQLLAPSRARVAARRRALDRRIALASGGAP